MPRGASVRLTSCGEEMSNDSGGNRNRVELTHAEKQQQKNTRM